MSFRRQHIRNVRATIEAGTPLDGEYVYDQTLKTIRAGDGATLGGSLLKKWRYSFPISPAQITANQNDYNPTDLTIGETLFLNSDAARSITGIVAGGSGARITLINRGAFDITLKNADAGSTAANRFLFDGDVVLRANGSVELQYSVTDTRWMRANGGTKFSTVPQELVMAGVITPAQIAANQNDYAPADSVTATKTTVLASILRLSSDASRNITGMVDPRDGVVKTLINVGANPIVLKNADVGSTAANRFDFGADVTLAAKQSAKIRYDGTDSRWKLEAATAGASVAAGAVTAQTLAASAMAFVGMINGTLVPSVAGSALTVALKTQAGIDPSAADPVYAIFRNATAANGDYTVLTITAATSLVISSGSSLGVSANSTAFRVWVVGFNDAGTFRLGAINCLSGTDIYPLNGWGIATSTAEGGAGAADSAQTFYTGTAVAAKAYATLGYMTWETGLAAVGTWAAGPTRAQLFGPGVPLPGTPIGGARADVGSLATGTTLMTPNDTIPVNTQGDQYMSKAYTPQSAANLLDVTSQMHLSNSSGASQIAAMLFQDSIANAIKVADVTQNTAAFICAIYINHTQLANTTASTTFKIRGGGNTAGTFTFNGVSGGRLYGGTMNSFIDIRERMA